MARMNMSFLTNVVLSAILIIFSGINSKYYWFGSPTHNLFLLILNFIIIFCNLINIIEYFSKR